MKIRGSLSSEGGQSDIISTTEHSSIFYAYFEQFSSTFVNKKYQQWRVSETDPTFKKKVLTTCLYGKKNAAES